MRSDAGPRRSREFLSAYISGYVDGEGCFTVSISPRATLVVGWEVRPSLSVSQNGDRAEVLRLIQRWFGCGSIRPDRSDKTLKWETRRLEDLLGRVGPALRAFSAPIGKASRLRTIRSRVPPDGAWWSSKPAWADRDRRARFGHEPEREAAVSDGGNTREAASG
jgi:hypothetical protein